MKSKTQTADSHFPRYLRYANRPRILGVVGTYISPLFESRDFVSVGSDSQPWRIDDTAPTND